MANVSLPPGFRFHPTDVELVMYWLKIKVTGGKFPLEAISEIRLYDFAPWDLQGLACLKSKDLEWFFFCSLDGKYETGQRVKRSNEFGFWKTTGNDKRIVFKSRTVGWRKTLIFYEGKKPGTRSRSNWTMHEYRLDDKELPDASNYQNGIVLCKIHKKSGRGPKTGEQYGAPFEEEADDNGNGSLVPHLPATRSSSPRPEGQNAAMSLSALHSGNGQDAVLHLPQRYATPVVPEHHPSSLEHDIHKPVLNVFEDCNTSTSNISSIHQKLDSVVLHKSTVEDADAHEIFKDSEDTSDHINPNSIDQSNVVNNLEDENAWRQWLLEISEFLELDDLPESMEDEGAFIQWDDLLSPMEVDVSDCWMCDPLLAPNSKPEVMSGSGSNSGCKEPICDSAAVSPLKAGETLGQYAPQLLAGGEQIEVELSFEFLSEGEKSLTNMQFILGSILACPASATEYPSSLEGEDFRVGLGLSCFIIVKDGLFVVVEDEATVVCTADCFLGLSRGFQFLSYHELAETQVRMETISMNGNFMFVVPFKGCVSFDRRCSSCLSMVPNLGGIYGESMRNSFVTISFPCINAVCLLYVWCVYYMAFDCAVEKNMLCNSVELILSFAQGNLHICTLKFFGSLLLYWFR